MLEINMEYKKGILFIRLYGELTKLTISTFEEDVIPVILKHGIKYIVINLDKLNKIDLKGIEALMNLNEIINNLNGKATLCSLSNENVRKKLREKEYISNFYETSNELTALGVMKI